MLTNDPWLLQMSFITFLTSVSLCLVFFFPINYLDLLYRYARHLGTWEPQIPEGNYKQQVTGGNIRFQPHKYVISPFLRFKLFPQLSKS